MKIKYRPEIDGLRAIAVLSVIFYHSQITLFEHELFKGGFIGVDIFFVISGYLITSIILKEILINDSFSFINFYKRRARRILPALLFVIVLSLPVAWIYLVPESFLDYSKSIISSLSFGSNFYFHYSESQYGSDDSLLKPFLHTWSLSVEEQYYIIFPFFLFFSFRYLKLKIIYVLIFFFFTSLILANWLSDTNSSANFYFLHSRLWELLAGSILAFFETEIGSRSKNKILNLILPAIGLILIIFNIFFFKLYFPHPSFYTLPTIIGTCLIIWFSSEKELITNILSSKIIVNIGLISYSLYLWHYPIFALDNIIDFSQEDITKKIILGTIIFLLSLFSFLFVEKPIRENKYKYLNNFLALLLITSSIIVINILIINKDGFKYRFENIYLKNNFFRDELRDKSFYFIKNHNIQLFESKKKIKILIIGDSHSVDLFNSFIQNTNLFNNYEFKRYGNDIQSSFRFDKYQNKNDLIKFNQSELFKHADIILISDYFDDNESFSKLDYFIELYQHKKHIILTSNSNIYDDNFIFKKYYKLSLFDYYLLRNKKNKKLIDQNLTQNEILKINQTYFNHKNNKKINEINNKLKVISNKYNIKLLSKNLFQCDDKINICYGATNNGMKIHYDYGHFTLEGAKFFGKKIHDLNWFQLN